MYNSEFASIEKQFKQWKSKLKIHVCQHLFEKIIFK